MKMRIFLLLTLTAMILSTVTGCGSGNTTVTPVKDATAQPSAAPAAGADST